MKATWVLVETLLTQWNTTRDGLFGSNIYFGRFSVLIRKKKKLEHQTFELACSTAVISVYLIDEKCIIFIWLFWCFTLRNDDYCLIIVITFRHPENLFQRKIFSVFFVNSIEVWVLPACLVELTLLLSSLLAFPAPKMTFNLFSIHNVPSGMGHGDDISKGKGMSMEVFLWSFRMGVLEKSLKGISF